MALRLFDNEHYLKLESVNEGQMLDHIPGHVYRIAATPDGPILVKDRKRFELGERRYGDFQKRFDLIASAYDPTMPSIGALLIGLPGSGKSMLCEAICNWALAQDMPVLLIDSSWSPSMIQTFVRLMGKCVVYFDEFGKIYPEESVENIDQRQMLAYFSDTSLNGVINLVTANHEHELLRYFFNRPQRFRFLFRYSDLSVTDIDELANEYRLKDWQRLQMVRMGACHGLSWDMARDVALVLRECASPEAAMDQLQYLNVPGWVSLTCGIMRLERHGEEVISECIMARFLNEEILQIRISDETTGELLETVTIPFNDPAIMGEPRDTEGFAEYEKLWAEADKDATPTPRRHRGSKQNAQNNAAGRVSYPFVRPAPHLRIHLYTNLECESHDPTSVANGCNSRFARDAMREETKRKERAASGEQSIKEQVTDLHPQGMYPGVMALPTADGRQRDGDDTIMVPYPNDQHGATPPALITATRFKTGVDAVGQGISMIANMKDGPERPR